MRQIILAASYLPIVGMFAFFAIDGYRHKEYNFSATMTLVAFSFFMLILNAAIQ